MKDFMANELSKVFGYPERIPSSVVKKALIYLMAYGIIMLVTFSIATVFTSYHYFVLGSIFSFFFVLEAFVLSAFFSVFAFLLMAYYGAYFARKGWDRS